MSHVRIASVQLGFRHCTIMPNGTRSYADPLVSVNPAESASDDRITLDSLRQSDFAGAQEHRVRSEIDRQARRVFTNWSHLMLEKLRQISAFCFEQDVDILVFPRSSVPVQCLDALLEFSTRMTIVAG